MGLLVENGDAGRLLQIGGECSIGVDCGGAGCAALLREVDGVVAKGDGRHFFGGWVHCGHEVAGILRKWCSCQGYGNTTLGRIR